MFTISKSFLQEPEFHSKLKKMPDGKKKLVEKKIIVTPDIGTAVENDGIVIDKQCGIDLIWQKPCRDSSFAYLIKFSGITRAMARYLKKYSSCVRGSSKKLHFHTPQRVSAKSREWLYVWTLGGTW